ncbi:hypothetical protein MTO96_034034 [Rhipicephalus appendiculatus]
MRRLRHPVTADYAVESSLLLRGRVTYHPLQRAVILPAAMRRLPVTYPESVPVEFEIGTVGTLLATELFRVASLAAYNKNKAPWTEWYKKSIRRLADCTQNAVVASAKSLGKEDVENEAFELDVWSKASRVALDVLEQYHLPKGGRGTPRRTTLVAGAADFLQALLPTLVWHRNPGLGRGTQAALFASRSERA